MFQTSFFQTTSRFFFSGVQPRLTIFLLKAISFLKNFLQPFPIVILPEKDEIARLGHYNGQKQGTVYKITVK